MKKLRILIALVIFLGCTVVLPIQAQAKVDLIPIGLNYSVMDVDVGYGVTLTATVPSGSGGTLTWSTSNSYVATVNASGYVFGQHAGTAVITATYTSASGATASASCTVYVTVADGLYYMKNVSSDLCFYTGGSAVSLQAQQTDASSRVGQLWKIRYVSGGKYEICPIRDTSVALTANDGNYVVVGETETAASWGLIQNANGYAIAYLGSSEETAKPVVASMPGTQIYLGEWQDALTCHWDLEPAAGLFLRDTNTQRLVTDSTVVIEGLGPKVKLQDLNPRLECYGYMSGGLTWLSSNTDIAYGNNDEIIADGYGQVAMTVGAKLNGVEYFVSFLYFARGTTFAHIDFDTSYDGNQNVIDQHINFSYLYNAQITGSIYTSATKASFINSIISANYCTIVAHGRPNGEMEMSSGEILTVSEVEAIPDADFSDVKLIVLTSCYSANPNQKSFADVFLDKGVDVVIGFADAIERDTSLFWTEWFIFYITSGYSVGESIEKANNDLVDKFWNKKNGDQLYNESVLLITEEINISDLEAVWDLVLFPQLQTGE